MAYSVFIVFNSFPVLTMYFIQLDFCFLLLFTFLLFFFTFVVRTLPLLDWIVENRQERTIKEGHDPACVPMSTTNDLLANARGPTTCPKFSHTGPGTRMVLELSLLLSSVIVCL